jgi:hypothetical protein
MLRKTLLAIAATAAIGTAALAPTSASAHWGGGWHGGWYGFHPFVTIGGPVYDGCTVQRWVHTRHGNELRWVNVCY